jgi:hypothetical protein
MANGRHHRKAAQFGDIHLVGQPPFGPDIAIPPPLRAMLDFSTRQPRCSALQSVSVAALGYHRNSVSGPVRARQGQAD